jgi:hypothetical protein
LAPTGGRARLVANEVDDYVNGHSGCEGASAAVLQRRPLSVRARHGLIARHLDRIPFAQWIEKRVAMHYHTGYPRSDLAWENTRRTLQAIPGIELIDIENPAALGRHWRSRGSEGGAREYPRHPLSLLSPGNLPGGDALPIRDCQLHRLGQAIGIEPRTSTSGTSSEPTRSGF